MIPTGKNVLRFSLIISTLLVMKDRTHAQWNSIDSVQSFERTADGVELNAPPAKVQITVLSPEIIRIRMSKDGKFLLDSSWAVIQKELGSRSFELKDSKSEITLSTSKITLRIQKYPCRLAIYDAAGNLINQDDPGKGMAWAGNQVSAWKTMPHDEFYFGFGEKAGSLQKKGRAMSMWNSDIPAYKADTDPLYETIPFFYGVRKGRSYGIFFDNTYYSSFNMGKENPDQYSFGAVDGELNYYFIYGPKPKDVLQKFSDLTGRMPLPPKWAVAYQQCRYSYYPEKRVREIAATFRKKKIPCDVIYLDIHYMDGYRCFTWDRQRFPDMKKMVGDLANNGFKMVVIIDPGIKNEPGYWVYDEGVKGNHFVRFPGGKYFVGRVWPGDCVFPDFTRRESREWWGSLYKPLVDAGIKGFWNDMNEPAVFDGPGKTFDLSVIHDDNGLKTDHRKSHNIYGMQMARGTYEGTIKLHPNERTFVLTRASYAGGNRYAAAWTGDNISSWEHLEMAVPMCLNLSVSGQPFVGTDIGGFVGSPSGELYARWLQLGVFTPLMRTHTEFGSADQEPWSYGAKYEAVNRKSIELRYRLLPYIYTQFYKASRTGAPIMRPLWFDYPEDEATYRNERDFLFGDAFLVAPVVWPGETMRDAYLPAGDWYDYWSGEKYTGPRYVRVEAPIDRIPLFVKAGAIIPTQQAVQYSDQAPIDPLTIEAYPAVESSAEIYEDDGKTFGYQRGEFCIRTVAVRPTAPYGPVGKKTEVELSAPEGSYRPPKRTVVLKVNGISHKPSSVSLDGSLLKESQTSSKNGWPARQLSGWHYDRKSKVLFVRFPDETRQQLITVQESR